MSYDSRLFRKPQIRRIVEISDDLINTCGELNDALAGYEDADTLTGVEAVEQREDARAEAWTKMHEILSAIEELRTLADRLDRG